MLIKCHLNSFFLEKAALDIVTLFLINEVLLWTGVLEVGLLGERSIELILPKVTSCGRAQERINVLVAARCGARTELRLTNRVTHLAEFTGGRFWEYVVVVAWSRLLRIFDLSVFTVGNFRAEDAVIALRTEILLLFCCFRLVINAGAWVFSWRVQLVLNFNRRLEELSYILRGLKVTNLGSFLVCMHIGVVQGRSYRVLLWPTSFRRLPSACVHI